MSTGAFDHSRFKDIAAGVQSVVATLALAIAGVWVVFSFVTLKSQQKAAAEVASLELAAKQEPVLQIGIAVSTSQSAASGPQRVSILARLKNDGKRALEFTAPILRIVPEDPRRGTATRGMRVAAEVVGPDGAREDMPKRILRAGQERTIAFWSPPLEPGDYFFQLEVQYSGMDNIDGRLVASNDEPIDALEQHVFRVQ